MKNKYKKLKVDYERSRRDRDRLLVIKKKIKPITKILDQIKEVKVGKSKTK